MVACEKINHTDSRANEQHKTRRDKPAVPPLPDPFVTILNARAHHTSDQSITTHHSTGEIPAIIQIGSAEKKDMTPALSCFREQITGSWSKCVPEVVKQKEDMRATEVLFVPDAQMVTIEVAGPHSPPTQSVEKLPTRRSGQRKTALAEAVNTLTLLPYYGGAEGDRTPDLLNAIQALSQLSYSPEESVL